MQKKKVVALLLTAALMVGCSSGGSTAQESSTAASEPAQSTAANLPEGYPDKPITMICPWGAGGGSDILCRILAQGGEKYLGQPIEVVNRDGAGGVIATTEFLKEKGDGYTILFEGSPVFVSQPKLNEVSYSEDDFRSIIATTEDPIVLTTHKNSPFKTLDEMLEYGKENTIKYGNTGAGGLLDVAQKALYEQMGVQYTGITLSGGEATSSLLGGHIDVIALHPINIMANEESGDFIPMAVFSEERIEQYPDVPTVKELGYDMQFEIWKMIMAPKDTPDEIIEYLYEGFNNIMNDPDLRQKIEATGTDIIPEGENTPEATDARLKQDVEQTGKVLDDLGLSKTAG